MNIQYTVIEMNDIFNTCRVLPPIESKSDDVSSDVQRVCFPYTAFPVSSFHMYPLLLPRILLIKLFPTFLQDYLIQIY